MSDLKEMQFVKSLFENWPRDPNQKNQIYTSDAELIHWDRETDLVLTTDTLCEEALWRLLYNPETLGWVNVISSLSDLAAMGADPIGLLLGMNCSNFEASDWNMRIWKASRDALIKHQVPLIGGDTNLSNDTIYSSTALGKRSTQCTLNRKGGRPGDQIYIGGLPGAGVATGFANFILRKMSIPLADKWDLNFRPKINFKLGKFLLNWANCCIDTSDGLLSAINLLNELNGTGAKLFFSTHLFHALVHQIQSVVKQNWLLFLSIHLGDFHLLWSVPLEKATDFENEIKKENLRIYHLGEWTDSPNEIIFGDVALDYSLIKNSLSELTTPELYLKQHQDWVANYSEFNFIV